MWEKFLGSRGIKARSLHRVIDPFGPMVQVTRGLGGALGKIPTTN
jgi:hypothetical protein